MHKNCKCKAENKSIKRKKRKKMLKQKYMFKPIVRKKKKSDIDRVAYYNKIFLPLLYLFHEQI